MNRIAIGISIATALALAAPLAAAQQSVKIANVVELSGTGTTAGTNFKNGVELAVKEINAAGGILGRKIVLENADTQSNPAIAKALTTKAIDNEVYVVMGPVFSGSSNVSMAATRRDRPRPSHDISPPGATDGPDKQARLDAVARCRGLRRARSGGNPTARSAARDRGNS